MDELSDNASVEHPWTRRLRRRVRVLLRRHAPVRPANELGGGRHSVHGGVGRQRPCMATIRRATD